MAQTNKIRCNWANSHELLLSYHDTVWGKPEHDSLKLFEKLNLDGAQAGLSWLTILKKTVGYEIAFSGFDPKIVASYNETKVNELMQDASIIRNRLKIEAFITNSKCYLKLQQDGVSFSDYIWGFSNKKPLKTRSEAEKVAEVLSKDLKKRGFKFVGPTICYAFMQAIGMINDHEKSCFRYKELSEGLS